MRRILITITSMIVFLAACSGIRVKEPAVTEDYPITTYFTTSQFNFQRNTTIHDQIAPPLSLVWEEDYISLPKRGFVTYHSLLIFGTYRGHLIFTDAVTGKSKGKENFGESCPAPPTIYKSILYQSFSAGSEGLIAYDTIEGDILWEIENMFSQSAPVVAEDKVFHVSSNGILSCFHYRSGELIWQRDLNSSVQNSLAYKDNLLIAATMNSGIFAVDAKTGNIEWQSPVHTPVFADPVIWEQAIYISAYDGSFLIVSLKSGSAVNRIKFSAPFYVAPTVSQNMIFVPVSSGELFAFDAQTFVKLWTFTADGPPAESVLVTDDFVYFAALDTRLYVLERTSGDLLQEIELGGRPRSTPLISGGKLFISCEDTRILAYAAQNDSI